MIHVLDVVGLAASLTVLALGTFALMMKLMIFALALDDWWEARSLPSRSLERMVAEDEAVSSGLRVAAVVIVVLVGLTWALAEIYIMPFAVVRWVFVIGLLAQAVLAVLQGLRAMFIRRKLAMLLSNARRPVGRPVMLPTEPEPAS